ncbi:hypothetical protein E4U42_001658 [Claviceps africana]|uniref:WD40 domain-containing protein n=1 Tax=Claviceps africana TaxID=83212 RepID=A0A8K0JDI6_9HYPO|nr:hypothetical protein E4U42_001658 [Claviceps africana]
MRDAVPAPMHHSRPFKSSPHCKPSPDGLLVAVSNTASSISIRSTKTLQTVHAVKLAPELTGPVGTLMWSPSSTKILISAADQIQVSSARDSSFRAVIRNPSAPLGGIPIIRFGASDWEVLTCAPFGLKLSVFDLVSSRAVEINNPKFFQPASAHRGFSIRPATGHLVVLTRVGGKDMISVHHPSTRQITKSWQPETLDAQGIQWTPDGQWIILWESPTQGRKLFIYSSDGQHYRTLDASRLMLSNSDGIESDTQLGIKACQLSGDAKLCAIGDHSRGVVVLQTHLWRSMMRLWHPSIITASETLQVWQEQIRNENNNTRTFLRAEKPTSPQVVVDSSTTPGDTRLGCSCISFDASSTLLATRLDDSPFTIWIWDLAAGELRATLMFHSAVSFVWHPSSREVLLIWCQEDGRQSASYVWDPLSQGPKSLNVERYLPTCEGPSKLQISWLNHTSESPEILASDTQHYVLLSLADTEDEANPWGPAVGSIQRDSTWTGRDEAESIASASPIVIAEDVSKLDDTFSFKHN